MNFIKSVWRFAIKTKWRQKFHVIAVVLLAAWARFCILFVPYKWYRNVLGQRSDPADVCPLASPEQIMMAKRCGQFIERICDKLPWEAKCLVQAMVFSVYARFYKIPYVLQVGMAKANRQASETAVPSAVISAGQAIAGSKADQETNQNKEAPQWLAHAWVQVGPWVVTGGDDGGLKEFTILSSYHSKFSYLSPTV